LNPEKTVRSASRFVLLKAGNNAFTVACFDSALG